MTLSSLDKFKVLTQQWINETVFELSMTKIIEHPAYQEIIAMGNSAIPLILQDLKQNITRHWGYALRVLTGAWPAPKENAGKIKLIAEAWLEWGKENGFL